MQRRFAILDRDGTLIVERNYLADPAGVMLLPNAAQGLRKLAATGYRFIVVTNQSGIGRGYFNLETLNAIHLELRRQLAEHGVKLEGIYFCPHHPDDACACRKPNDGLVRQAALHHGFDPATCPVIGDNLCDVELGRRVGSTKTILLRTGHGATVLESGKLTTQPDYLADDLLGAADWLLAGQTAASRQPAADTPTLLESLS